MKSLKVYACVLFVIVASFSFFSSAYAGQPQGENFVMVVEKVEENQKEAGYILYSVRTKISDESKDALMSALYEVRGVLQVVLDDYSVAVFKGTAFSETEVSIPALNTLIGFFKAENVHLLFREHYASSAELEQAIGKALYK